MDCFRNGNICSRQLLKDVGLILLRSIVFGYLSFGEFMMTVHGIIYLSFFGIMLALSLNDRKNCSPDTLERGKKWKFFANWVSIIHHLATLLILMILLIIRNKKKCGSIRTITGPISKKIAELILINTSFISLHKVSNYLGSFYIGDLIGVLNVLAIVFCLFTSFYYNTWVPGVINTLGDIHNQCPSYGGLIIALSVCCIPENLVMVSFFLSNGIERCQELCEKIIP